MPDIEIYYRDIIQPLITISEMDKEIAGELFEEIFIYLFKSPLKQDEKDQSLQCLATILKQTSKYDYATISTVHKIFLQLSRNFYNEVELYLNLNDI